MVSGFQFWGASDFAFLANFKMGWILLELAEPELSEPDFETEPSEPEPAISETETNRTELDVSSGFGAACRGLRSYNHKRRDLVTLQNCRREGHVYYLLELDSKSQPQTPPLLHLHPQIYQLRTYLFHHCFQREVSKHVFLQNDPKRDSTPGILPLV